MNLHFSVVIPLYNKAEFIEDTLKSVLNQNYKYFEIIIVNDGSTDGSAEIIKRFTDKRITILNQENKGLSGARNAGIKASKHAYIAFIDADDLWCEDYLLTMYHVIKRYTSHNIFTMNTKLFRPNEAVILSANQSEFNPNNIEIIPNYFSLSKNIFGYSSLVVNKDVFEKIGFFDETVTYGEGDDFFIRCFSVYDPVHYLEQKAYYRIGIQNQLTAPNKNSNRIIPDYDKYLTKNKDKNLKKHIDFIHFKLVVLYKMEKNSELVTFYKRKIDTVNLSTIQKIKYHLPTSFFYIFKKIYLKVSSI